MQILLEMLAAVVIWIAATGFSALGVDVDQPRGEPKAEKVIPRDAPPPAKAVVGSKDCPEAVAPTTSPAPTRA